MLLVRHTGVSIGRTLRLSPAATSCKLRFGLDDLLFVILLFPARNILACNEMKPNKGLQ